MRLFQRFTHVAALLAATGVFSVDVLAQDTSSTATTCGPGGPMRAICRPPTRAAAASPPSVVEAAGAPADYVIGAEDVLGVLFWREQDMSGDVTVRPDGFITLPLVGEIQAAGKRPHDLRGELQTAAQKYFVDTNVTVVVRQINSRKVYVTGQVATPGTYPLTGPRTVMQLIALAGGLTEYADAKGISIVRQEQGRTRSFRFNYRDAAKGRNLQQNILLQPGDTVVVP